MATNTHFEKTVRIQKNRNHKTITNGPYKIVRHPGYTAIILGHAIGIPLVLGSAWAFVPAVFAIVFLGIRKELEDQFLQKNLLGYAAFTTKTRHKLIPGIW